MFGCIYFIEFYFIFSELDGTLPSPPAQKVWRTK